MRRLDISVGLSLLSVLFIPITISAPFSQDDPSANEVLNQLVLNIYIDDGGRALINGYVDDPGSLAFLNPSEYTYEDDSGQLYAITSALTSKSRDIWTMRFESEGSYDEYQIIFYLPKNAQLREVNCSLGLDYSVYAANESIITEVHGASITDPAANIEYIIPLAEVSRVEADTFTGADAGYQYKITAFFLLVVIGSGLLIFLRRSRYVAMKPTGRSEIHEPEVSSKVLAPNESDFFASIEPRIDTGQPDVSKDKEVDGNSRISETAELFGLNEKQNAGIELSGEISAVMDTLTDKEQSILRALLQRGGMMTQTEIRYELDISKSSLSGILTSMEKRKIITKREKGRTNVIKLSERFLNIEERS